jgi:hypothetical protein
VRENTFSQMVSGWIFRYENVMFICLPDAIAYNLHTCQFIPFEPGALVTIPDFNLLLDAVRSCRIYHEMLAKSHKLYPNGFHPAEEAPEGKISWVMWGRFPQTASFGWAYRKTNGWEYVSEDVDRDASPCDPPTGYNPEAEYPSEQGLLF